MTTSSDLVATGGDPPSAERERVTVAQGVVLVMVALPAGVAAAWLVAGVGSDRLLTATTAIMLCLPAGVALYRLRQSPQGVVPVIVGLGIIFFFVPRLLAFDPGSGLLDKIPMTPDEIDRSKTITQVVLIAFALPIALVFGSVPTPRHQLEEGDRRQETLRKTLRFRTAIVLGLIGSMVGLSIGLTMGIRSRNFSAAGESTPLSLLEFCAITAPAALWLAGHRRLSAVFLVLSMAGPYFTGGRQQVLTPLVVLLIAVLASRARRTSGRGRISVKAVAIVTLIVVVGVGAAIATTSRRAAVDNAESGGKPPSLFSSLVLDQTLLDPLIVAVAREPRPQGPEIYGRVLTAPIPRAVWHDKPFSYDYDFRQRHFPHYEDAIPISLVGTSFVSLLVPGVVLAGWLVALLALAAEWLLGRSGQRSILVAAVLVIFILDLIRIGGMYRELLTFVGSATGAVLITVAAPRLLRPTSTLPRE